jgi:serine/threonine-protein kinase
MSAQGSNSEVVLALAEEFLERYRQGERPSLKEYADRHPELAAEIREVFPAMALMENIALADESLAEGPAAGGAAQAPPLRQLGDYRILREVGRGGMGVVYEAEQVSLGRHVALKVLPRQLLDDAQQRRRFEREAKAAAKLHHTNIVPVYGVGEHGGLPYYVMQFIQGLGLDEVIDELRRLQSSGPASQRPAANLGRDNVSAADMARSLLTGAFQASADPTTDGSPAGVEVPAPPAARPLSDTGALSASAVALPGASAEGRPARGKPPTYWHRVAHLGVQVADALAHAHQQGIVHRDIKPSNLLLDARGTVWVTDFGLAKADDQQNLTHTGDILGTLRYMPPEAFDRRADARGDIYALGLTLYELLALQPAFGERDRNRLVKQVMGTDPVRLDRLNPAIPRDLVTVVQKAIDREPGHRYQTAPELASDLQRFLDDEPIQARRLGLRERAGRWCRRNPVVAGLTAALVLILTGTSVASLAVAARFRQLAGQQAEAAARAESAREQALANLQEADRQRQRAEMNFARARAAVDAYLTRVSENQLLKVSGMQPLRRDLLQSALTFYQDFLKEHGNDPALRAELAAAQLRLGRINLELGLRSEARGALKEAVAGFESALKVDPQNANLQAGLADASHALAVQNVPSFAGYFLLQVSPEMLNGVRRAAEIREALQRTHPTVARYQKVLAQSYVMLGALHGAKRENGEAVRLVQRAIELLTEVAGADPEDPENLHALAQAFTILGILSGQTGRNREVLTNLKRATEYGQAACTLMPQALEYGYSLTFAYLLTGAAYYSQGQGEAGRAQMQKAIEFSQQVVRDNPSVPGSHALYCGTLACLAKLSEFSGKKEDAAHFRAMAEEAFAKLPRGTANELYLEAGVRASYARVVESMAAELGLTAEDRQELQRQADLALQALRKAIALGYKNVEQMKTDEALAVLQPLPEFKQLVSELEAAAAAEAEGAGAPRAAGERLARRLKLAAADPRVNPAAAHHARGLVQLDSGNPEQALQSFTAALRLREQLVTADPGEATNRADLADTYLMLGTAGWKAGRLAEAAEAWQKGLEILAALARDDPNDPARTDQLAEGEYAVGKLYAELGIYDRAADHLERAERLHTASRLHHARMSASYRLRAGDLEGYRRDCAQLLQWFGQLQDPDTTLGFRYRQGAAAEVVVTCVLGPGAVGDLTAVLHMAERTVAADPNRAFFQHILAAAHYRLGQYPDALRCLDEADRVDPAWALRVCNPLLRAMAYNRLGQADRARQALAQAAQWYEEDVKSKPPAPFGGMPYWQSHSHFENFRHEAWTLVDGAPAVAEVLADLERAQRYFQLGESKKADELFQAAAVARPREPAVWLTRARLFAEQKRQAEADRDFARALELPADDARLWQEHARRFARLGRWSWASRCYSRAAVALTADKGDPGFEQACLLLLSGDRDGYRRTCAQMLEAEGVRGYLAARACTLTPLAADELARAEKAAATELANNPRYWALTATAGLHYRAGRFREAAASARRCLNEHPAWDGNVLNWLWLALASQGLGQPDEARQWLDKAARWLDRYPDGMPTRAEGSIPLHLHDWLEAHALRREAETWIGQKPK